MSSKHDQAHQDIDVRLLLLEGMTPPPNPNPPPAPPPAPEGNYASYDFVNDTPSGVTVTRSGSNATRRSGANSIEIMAANTLRYQHNAAGAVMGLLIEKAATNYFPNAVNPAGSFAALGSGVTIDDNYAGATAPDGTNRATRVTVGAGNAAAGVRYGVSGVLTDGQPYSVFLWGRSLSGSEQEVMMRDPATGTYDSDQTLILGTDWTLIELYGAVAASDHYNFDVACPDADGMDILLFMPAVQPGVASVASMGTPVATSGGSGTRPMETLHIDSGVPGETPDVRVTWFNDTVQDFTTVAVDEITGIWDFEADFAVGNCIKAINFYPANTLGGSSPPPGPTPPPASNILTVDSMIAQMGANPGGKLYNSPDSGSWQHGAVITMGGDNRYVSTPTWWGPGNSLASGTPRWLAALMWFVLWDGPNHGDNLNCRVAMRDGELWTRQNNVWTRRYGPGQVGGELYARNLQGSGFPGADERREADGSLSVRFNHSSPNVYHGWGGMAVLPNSAIEAVQIRMRARKILHDPNGTDQRSSAQYLIAVGGDYYPDTDTNNQDMGVDWNPGIGQSRFEEVTNDWKAFVFTTVAGAYNIDNSPRSTRINQTITQQSLRDFPPPLNY